MSTTRLAAAAACIGLSAAGFIAPNAAADFITTTFDDDASANAVIGDVAFVAEGRIGDLGGAATFEYDIGPDTGSPASTGQFNWSSGESYSFDITYNDSNDTVVFALDGNVLIYVLGGGESFTDIFIRTRAGEDSSIMVTDLVVETEDVVGASSSASGDGDVEVLQISGASLADGFAMAGTVTMTWTGDPPSNSELAFQVKFATVTIIPTPGTVALLFGSVLVGRHRRRY